MHYAINTYGGVNVEIYNFLTSALVGGEWSASRPVRFNPGERATGAHWIGSRVDPRAGLNYVEKRQFLTLPGLELWPLSRQAPSLSLSRIHNNSFVCNFVWNQILSRIGLFEPKGG
jgi:hypothetical protein